MPITRIGVQAPAGSPGQGVDIDPEFISATLTNAGTVAVEYSTGGAWTSLAAGATSAGILATTSQLKLRRASGGAYPAPVDVAWLSRDGSTTSIEPIVPVLSESSDNTAAVADIIAGMTAGQTLQLPGGTYRLDITTTKGIKIVGAGRSAYAAGALWGGTILKGQITISDAIGAEISSLSIDQTTLTPASYPNAITAGLTTTSSTTKLNQRIYDVSVLGRGYSGGTQNSQHGILVQNGRGAVVERCEAYKFLNLFISRASGVTFNDCEGWDSEANVVLFKSESTGGANDALDNVAKNVRGFASTSAFFCNFTSLAQDAGGVQVTRNSKFIGCTARSVGGPAVFMAVGTVNANSNRDTKFIGCTSSGDTNGNAFLVNDDYADGVTFIGCHADAFTGFSFRSNATTATNLPTAIGCTAFRSDFPNLTNVSGAWARIEVNGQDWDAGNTRTVATLPSATFATRRFFVSDASSPTFGATVAGGGAVLVPVYSDGTNWKVG